MGWKLSSARATRTTKLIMARAPGVFCPWLPGSFANKVWAKYTDMMLSHERCRPASLPHRSISRLLQMSGRQVHVGQLAAGRRAARPVRSGAVDRDHQERSGTGDKKRKKTTKTLRRAHHAGRQGVSQSASQPASSFRALMPGERTTKVEWNKSDVRQRQLSQRDQRKKMKRERTTFIRVYLK